MAIVLQFKYLLIMFTPYYSHSCNVKSRKRCFYYYYTWHCVLHTLSNTLLPLCIHLLVGLGGKDRKHGQIFCEKYAIIAHELLGYTAPNHSFLVRSKTKKIMESLCVPRLQHHGSRSGTNFVHHRNIIVSFFRTRWCYCHYTALVQLSSNHIQPPKPLNNTKFRTATTSLCGPFYPGG